MRKIYFLANAIVLLNFLNITPSVAANTKPKNENLTSFTSADSTTNKITTGITGAIPIINISGSPILIKGDSVFMTASPSAGYSYQWAFNGVDVAGANTANFFAKNAGAYTVNITSIAYTTKSLAVAVTAAPDVITITPEFVIAAKNITVKGINNGAIQLSSSQKLNFTAILLNKALNVRYSFTDTLAINQLFAGDYSLSVTTKDSMVNKTFTITISEPKVLSVMTTINQDQGTVRLNLAGANSYTINIGGTTYTTKTGQITVPLSIGNNKLTVTSDISSQLPIEKMIGYETIVPYPNPVINLLNINVGDKNISNIDLNITNLLNGKTVYRKQYFNQSGVLQPDLSNISAGVYSLSMHLDNREVVYKIVKH